MCAACTGRSRGRRPPQCGPRAGTTATSSVPLPRTGGRGRLLLPRRERTQICAPPTPPSASPAAPRPPRWTPAHVPGRHARRSGTPPRRGPGPGLSRRAQPLSRPSPAAPQPAPRRPHLSRPDLSSPGSRGPAAHALTSGPGSLRRRRQGPRRGRRPLSVSPALLEPRLGNHLKPRPLGHAPPHHAPPLGRRGSAGLYAGAGAQVTAAHSGVRG